MSEENDTWKKKHGSTLKAANLKSILAPRRPFSMIFNRLQSKFYSFFFSVKHTMVTTVTLAVPLVPPKIKILYLVPRAIKERTI